MRSVPGEWDLEAETGTIRIVFALDGKGESLAILLCKTGTFST